MNAASFPVEVDAEVVAGAGFVAHAMAAHARRVARMGAVSAFISLSLPS
jgi:hypothetical protein